MTDPIGEVRGQVTACLRELETGLVAHGFTVETETKFWMLTVRTAADRLGPARSQRVQVATDAAGKLNWYLVSQPADNPEFMQCERICPAAEVAEVTDRIARALKTHRPARQPACSTVTTGPEGVRDMLTEHRHLFPLDANPDSTDSPQAMDRVVPFGLQCAAKPTTTINVDLPSISYDPDRQIAVVADSAVTVPAMRHTSTQTKTSTASQDRRGNDSDSDSTGT